MDQSDLNRGIKSWLDSRAMPGDYYELLGVPRFSRDRERLLEASRLCYASLQKYQNADEGIRTHARNLQLQCAAAVQVFSSDITWEQYDRTLGRTSDTAESHTASGRSTIGVEPPPICIIPPPLTSEQQARAIELADRGAPPIVQYQTGLAADPSDPQNSEAAGDTFRWAVTLEDQLAKIWRRPLPAFDPAGIRLMLYLAALTANALVVLAGSTRILSHLMVASGRQ